MATTLDEVALEKAFGSRADIQGAIRGAAAAGPAYIELFNQISFHVCSIITSESGPASKRRRVDDGGITDTPTNAINGKVVPINTRNPVTSGDSVLLEIKDISVIIPQQLQEPIIGVSYSWNSIDHALFLPVPEKSQKQHNYVLFPHDSTINPNKPRAETTASAEPFMFTISDGAPNPTSLSGLEAASAKAVADDYKTLFDWTLKQRLKSSVAIVRPDEKLFHSVQRQPQRPNEKAVHVRAFRGSKDGYLFFLPTGIFWGFKKPLLYILHQQISAVSYTNVLQRTFNLNVEVAMTGGEAEEREEIIEEFEFSMLDQEDYAGIDEYIKRYGLQDRSMAEQRKAKRLNVNVVKDQDGNVIGNAEAGELEKAAGELERTETDEEDEEEEDYDPGSEGESEGEGTSTEEAGDEGEGLDDDGDEVVDGQDGS